MEQRKTLSHGYQKSKTLKIAPPFSTEDRRLRLNADCLNRLGHHPIPIRHEDRSENSSQQKSQSKKTRFREEQEGLIRPRRRLSRSKSISVRQFRPAIGWRSSRIQRRDAKSKRDDKAFHHKIHQARRFRRRSARRRGLEWGWKMKSEIGVSLMVRAMEKAAKRKLNQGEMKFKEDFQKNQNGEESSLGKNCGINHQSWPKSKVRGVKKGYRFFVGIRIGFPVRQVIISEEKGEVLAMLYVEQGKSFGGGTWVSVIRKKRGAEWRKGSRERRLGVSKSIKRVRRSIDVGQRSHFRHEVKSESA